MEQDFPGAIGLKERFATAALGLLVLGIVFSFASRPCPLRLTREEKHTRDLALPEFRRLSFSTERDEYVLPEKDTTPRRSVSGATWFSF